MLQNTSVNNWWYIFIGYSIGNIKICYWGE